MANTPQDKYKAEKTQEFKLRFFPKDAALWQHLNAQPNRADYLRRLIEQDMHRST